MSNALVAVLQVPYSRTRVPGLGPFPLSDTTGERKKRYESISNIC